MFGGSIRVFRLLGFDIKLHASWFILALLIAWSLARGYFPQAAPGLSDTSYWVMGVSGALGLFASIILHELGHCVMARRHGIPIKGITLFLFGGVAEMEREPPTARSEFIMAAAGPVVSIVLGAAFYLVHFPLETSGILVASAVTAYLGWINGALALFNLVPAFPLDGGRMLRAYLWAKRGSLRQATRTASGIGSGFGLLLIMLGVFQVIFGNFVAGMWWFLIGMFLRGASQMSVQQLEIRRALEGEPIRRFMKRDPVTVPRHASLEDLVENYIYRHHFDMFPVEDGERLEGCISTRQVKQVPREEWRRHTVGELAVPCKEDNTISSDTDAVEVLARMRKTGNSRLLVVDEGRLVGIVTMRDLIDFLGVKLDLEGVGGIQSSDLPELTEARRQ